MTGVSFAVNNSNPRLKTALHMDPLEILKQGSRLAIKEQYWNYRVAQSRVRPED